MKVGVSVNFFFASHSQVFYDRLQLLPGQKVMNFSKNEQPAQNCVRQWETTQFPMRPREAPSVKITELVDDNNCME